MSRKLLTKYFFISISLLLPVQPMMAAAPAAPSQEQQMAILQQMMMRVAGYSQGAMADAAVGKLECFEQKDNVIGINERKELQLDDLAKKLDKTKTSFGRSVLPQSFSPSRNIEQVSKRQSWVKAVYDDQKLLKQIEPLFKRINKSEHAVLSYWDDLQQEIATKLFFRSKALYFSLLSKIFGERINQNKLTLEASFGIEAFSIFTRLIAQVGLNALQWELFEWNFGRKSELEWWKAIKRGFFRNFTCFWPFETEIGRTYSTEGGSSWLDANKNGSWRDAWKANQVGYNDDSRIYVGPLACLFRRILPSYKFNVDKDKYVHVINKQAEDNVEDNVCVRCLKKTGSGLVSAGFTTAVMVWRIKEFFEDLQVTYGRVVNFTKTMRELHIHTVHMARTINAMKKLSALVSQHSVLKDSCIAQHMLKTLQKPSDDLQKLFDLLEKDTFTPAKTKSQFYSRANVLLAHRLMMKVHKELTPLLQGVGELDALCAIVANMKEVENTETPYTFAEFVSGTQAMIELEDAWLPIVKDAVPNSTALGADHPNKIVITGPNGGGKSVYLKMLGCSVVLAQSWGVVPAKRVRMTLFDGLRSCIHPEENLEHELSTFMAEKLRIDDIKSFVFRHNNPDFKVMLLLDEPFRGTVDSESADRIYEFGKEIAPLQGLIVGIATHVEKPIKLAQDTGVFANYHVRIKEIGTRFEREFKLDPGVPQWWFNDPRKRSKFIDYITFEKHKEKLEQIRAGMQNGATNSEIAQATA